jgi:hypothetical protein
MTNKAQAPAKIAADKFLETYINGYSYCLGYVGWDHSRNEPLPFRFADLEFNIQNVLAEGISEKDIYDVMKTTLAPLEIHRILTYSIWYAAQKK